MNVSIEKVSPPRRWRHWWLTVPMLLTLTICVALIGYNQLRAQEQPARALSPANFIPQSPLEQPTIGRPTYQIPVKPADPRPIDQANQPTGSYSYAPLASAAPHLPDQYVDAAVALAKELQTLDAHGDEYATKLAALEKAVAEQFDQRHEHQSEQIETAENQVQQLKHELEQRSTAKQQIVSRRVKELLGEPDPLRWDSTLQFGPGTQAISRYPRVVTETRRSTNYSPTTNYSPVPSNDPRSVPKAAPLSPALSYEQTPSGQWRPIGQTYKDIDSVASSRVLDANQLAIELSKCNQQIRAAGQERKQTELLVARNVMPVAELELVQSKLAATEQQKAILTLQYEQLMKQSAMQLEHADQAVDNAQQRLDLAKLPLDASDPASHRQQRRDVAEAETRLLEAKQHRERLALEVEQLKLLKTKIQDDENTEGSSTADPAPQDKVEQGEVEQEEVEVAY